MSDFKVIYDFEDIEDLEKLNNRLVFSSTLGGTKYSFYIHIPKDKLDDYFVFFSNIDKNNTISVSGYLPNDSKDIRLFLNTNIWLLSPIE